MRWPVCRLSWLKRDLLGLRGRRVQRDRAGDEGQTQEAFPVRARGHGYAELRLRGRLELKTNGGAGSDIACRGRRDSSLTGLERPAESAAGRLTLRERKGNIWPCPHTRSPAASRRRPGGRRRPGHRSLRGRRPGRRLKRCWWLSIFSRPRLAEFGRRFRRLRARPV